MNQMMNLKQRLMSLDKDIRVAVIGIGSMGKGLVYQIHATPGMSPVAIADIHIKRAIDCARWLQLEYDIVDTVADLNYAIQRGRLAITDNGELLASSNLVHVMIESSNAVLQGAVHAMRAISNHQHVVMMNFEADLMYGPLLLRAAQDEGVVYTCADGDKPTAIKKLVDEIKLCGFDLVMAGNIKNFQDRYSTPDKIAFEADMRGLDHSMCSYFADGTKLCVEMAVLANAINGRTAVPGMIGQRGCSIHDVFKQYDFDKLWDGKRPLVDYMLGVEPKGGVFVIGHTNDKFQQATLGWFPPDIGPGPYYLFYRPYYLGHIEAMQCVAEAYLENTARLQPAHGMKTNVFAYAKHDLKKGDVLDGKGGSHCYGLIENMEDNMSSPGLPVLISNNLKLKRDIAKDERIRLEDVEYDPNEKSFSLYFEACGIYAPENIKRQEPAIDVTYQFV
ncbi:homoserine dehydrogenase [Chryseosolibacter histidini]|nr:homoserine dehydrogenase [Chryseosolibacter histidini]